MMPACRCSPRYYTLGRQARAGGRCALSALALLVFLLLPILVIMPLSFSASSFLVYPMPGWSLQWYENLFTSAEWARAAKNSFIVAPAATLHRHRARHAGRGRPGAHAVPRQGAADERADRADGGADRRRRRRHATCSSRRIGLADSYTGLIIVHAALGAPFVVTTVLATLQGFNHNLVRASLSLGAGPVQTFFRVTLPVIAPGVISGALFAFATSFDEVVVTLFLAGPDTGDAAAADVHRHPREHQPDHRRGGHAADRSSPPACCWCWSGCAASAR